MMLSTYTIIAFVAFIWMVAFGYYLYRSRYNAKHAVPAGGQIQQNYSQHPQQLPWQQQSYYQQYNQQPLQQQQSYPLQQQQQLYQPNAATNVTTTSSAPNQTIVTAATHPAAFYPPYSRLSRVPLHPVGHSMDVIRAESGTDLKLAQEMNHAREMEMIRSEGLATVVVIPEASPPSPSSSTSAVAAASSSSSSAPPPVTLVSSAAPLSRPVSSTIASSPAPDTRTPHEREMDLIRQSSGAHLM